MHRASLSELSAALAERRISSVELTQLFLERIARHNAALNAFITVHSGKSLAQARAADARIAQGEGGPLTGSPLAHKDIFCTRDLRTTCGSRMRADYVSPYDAHGIERFAAAYIDAVVQHPWMQDWIASAQEEDWVLEQFEQPAA